MAFTPWTEPALARSYLNCLAKKVVIVDTPRGSTSSNVEKHLGFWIDEAAKTLVLADGTPLTVHRFEDHWISAARGDTSYELDRQNGNLTYASSTTRTVRRQSQSAQAGAKLQQVRRGKQTTRLATRFPAQRARAIRSCFLSDIQTRRPPHSRRRAVRNALRKDEQRLCRRHARRTSA